MDSSKEEDNSHVAEDGNAPASEPVGDQNSPPPSPRNNMSKQQEEGEFRPPLPPRPTQARADGGAGFAAESGLSIRPASKGHLQSRPTTAVSLAGVNTQSFQDGSREMYFSFPERLGFGKNLKSKPSVSQLTGARAADFGDSASIRSYIPGVETPADVASILGDLPGVGQDTPHDRSDGKIEPVALSNLEDEGLDDDFEDEFDPVGEIEPGEGNADEVMTKWRKKRKHFFILSTAGKPIYSRHGDDNLISSYIGVIQTLISIFQESDNPLKSFTAGKTKIVILSQGPLYLVAISRLLESEAQLRAQLDALYMQILSTLTLPSLQRLFSIRPSTDLRRPLQGTEGLLSSLADSFTKGSPSTLLSALECLKMRKSHRQNINNVLLKAKVDSLLYGLVVAGGKLVSVIRPKKHSLHPGDLQLIFNMIFEADGVKAGGGESWIPVCLPGFNNTGYLHMYVSFLDLDGKQSDHRDDERSKDELVAIILISPDKESFYELREMRDAVVEQLERNGSMSIIKATIEKGRPATTDIVPGTVLRHFLYKSKANVQFTMSSYYPDFATPLDRRRLLSTYHSLHAGVHAKHTNVKILHCISSSMNSLAWVTPTFELYCVASPNSNRNAISQSANRIVKWAQQEEERIFIIGGAVF
ncbi:hypothetical protein VTO42DRAFT_7103 [Malbranchea cinnamomea]